MSRRGAGGSPKACKKYLERAAPSCSFELPKTAKRLDERANCNAGEDGNHEFQHKAQGRHPKRCVGHLAGLVAYTGANQGTPAVKIGKVP